MLIERKLIRLKASTRSYFLSLALLLSFFTTAGYVNNTRPASGVITTEILAVKHASFKSSICYKRGVLAFGHGLTVDLGGKLRLTAGRFNYSKLVVVRYLHLNLLSLSYKSIARFQFTPRLYPADEDHLPLA